MGRAARWLRRLLGGKERVGVGIGGGGGSERKPEKKRWSFGKGGCERGGGVVSVRGKTPEEAAWLSSASSFAEGEKEQNKHAIKVAAATAAAADAAIAAAQAAVVVVRLTSQGRGAMLGVQERLAAVKIQTVFRSYLARKALRALKALVKLQALVRGYLVRKQAATTFHCMQSLIRAQTTIRAQRSRRILACDTRSSLEGLSETPAYIYLRRPSSTNYSFDRSPKTVEIDTYRPNWQSSNRISPDIADDLPPFTVPSPLNCRLRPTRLADPELNDSYYDTPHKCRGLPNTTHSTPRYNAAPPTPPTPTKNEPGYMAKTRSFEAKTRSQSAPKQRPETPRKKAEMVVESRPSLSGVERCSLSRGVDRSFGLGRESCFERKW